MLHPEVIISIVTAPFQFSLAPLEPIILPPYKGSTLRGGFGAIFRRIVCVMKDKECPECLLKGKCVYSYVFETPPPPDTEIMRKYKAAPHPFVIEQPHERKQAYKPGEELIFGLVLVGRAIDYLPYFIYTFDELGKTGLGRGRGKFELKTVRSCQASGVRSQGLIDGTDKADIGTNLTVTPVKTGVQEDSGETINRVIYSAETKMLTGFETTELELPEGPFVSASDATGRLTLKFLTPTRIAYNGRLTLDLEFHMLIRNLLRRLSLLSYFHSNGSPLALDFKMAIVAAQDVEVVHRHLRWYDWERYSGRQEQRINMGGFVGEITLEGPVGPFLPFIKAGEILHVGKGTTFGLGRYVGGRP